jgi:magnesium chelatase family protein
MSIAVSYSAQLVGLSAEPVTVEVDISNGLHSFTVVGLGDRSVGESKDRIAAAIKNSGYTSPKQKNQKVVISLAPADLNKEGPSFDLAMAVAYLTAAGDIEFDSSQILFIGELSLEGKLRKTAGVLPIICQARARGFTEAIIPLQNSEEASLARDIRVYAASSLNEVIKHVSGTQRLAEIQTKKSADDTYDFAHDIASVRGNDAAKRGLMVAAAGAHNIIMCGPPGTGKTMLAQSLPSILPPLSYQESVEVTGIHSAARTLREGLILRPPFRSPHHTASYAAIVGGGTFPKPGEITLAHRGILFLDEFPEFSHKVVESLRQPLEERSITISRARGVITFPAQCILVAAMNPCPCGKGREKGCTCTLKMIETYNRRISGPIMDRIDIWTNVDKVEHEKLAQVSNSGPSSAKIREEVLKARERQQERFSRLGIKKLYNSEMNAEDIQRAVVMEEQLRMFLASSAAKLGLSGRAFHRIIKVAQTIADLVGSTEIKKEHLLEALQYRQKLEG